MLEVISLGVSYGSTRAVDGIDIKVGGGEAVALLGANGAGKTSSLRAISRLIPSEGTITFDGDVVTQLGPADLARRGLVHVPEGRHVFGTLTTHENLLIGETSRNGRKPMFSVSELYDLFPTIRPLQKRYGWALSGGEQQMVVISRALMSSPRLLMLDEPSLGLAPVVVKAVYQALKEIRSEMSILLVEQNASVALSLCNRAYVLSTGTCVLEGTGAELSDRDTLLDSYLGHAEGAGEAEGDADTADGLTAAPPGPDRDLGKEAGSTSVGPRTSSSGDSAEQRR